MRERLKELALEYRFSVLGGTAVLGLLLALAFIRYLPSVEWFLAAKLGFATHSGAWERLAAYFGVAMLGLPTLAALWFFRTHDTREQIAKSEESKNVNILLGAQKMLSETKINTAGLAILARLRAQGFHKDDIDSITRNAELSGTNLSSRSLRGVNLHNAKLRDATLTKANLTRANLTGANLTKAILTEADLTEADLTDAILTEADLQDADLFEAIVSDTNFEKAKLQGAMLRNVLPRSLSRRFSSRRFSLRQFLVRWLFPHGFPSRRPSSHGFPWGSKLNGAEYDNETRFPRGFDPDAHGMIYVGADKEES